tara:strand:+ start:17687 stop:17917 length:231 start_codon:yes stop_codon:yes gene_type:complete
MAPIGFEHLTKKRIFVLRNSNPTPSGVVEYKFVVAGNKTTIEYWTNTARIGWTHHTTPEARVHWLDKLEAGFVYVK